MRGTTAVYCSRNCIELATVEITAGTINTAFRSATACNRHRLTVYRWAAHVGKPTTTSIDQPQFGQLVLFPAPEVQPWRP